MGIDVVEYSDAWPADFQRVSEALFENLRGVTVIAIEHVGSTSVPGLAAKPILDVDVIVSRPALPEAVRALQGAGYRHLGDLGLTDREAFEAPDRDPVRNVYVCVEGTLHLRNHLAVRHALRSDTQLRDRYAAVKRELARQPGIDIVRYVSGKSVVLQDILATSDLTADEKHQVYELNAAP